MRYKCDTLPLSLLYTLDNIDVETLEIFSLDLIQLATVWKS